MFGFAVCLMDGYISLFIFWNIEGGRMVEEGKEGRKGLGRRRDLQKRESTKKNALIIIY
jgi:hypothetical protein